MNLVKYLNKAPATTTCRNSAELINYQCIRSRFSCCCCFVFFYIFCFFRVVLFPPALSLIIVSEQALQSTYGAFCLLSIPIHSITCVFTAQCAPITYYVFTILHTKKMLSIFESKQRRKKMNNKRRNSIVFFSLFVS